MLNLKTTWLAAAVFGLFCSFPLTTQATLTTITSYTPMAPYSGPITSPYGAGLPFLDIQVDPSNPVATETYSYDVFLAAKQTISGFGALYASRIAAPTPIGEIDIEDSHGRVLQITSLTVGAGWTPWSFIAPDEDTYKIVYSVTGANTKGATGLFVTVPEPATLLGGLLMGCMLVPGLGSRLKRKFKELAKH